MLFKSLTLLKITSAPYNLSMLTTALASASFVPCPNHDKSSSGFAYPIGTSQLRACTNGYLFLFKSQTRLLPTAVVNELWQDKIVEIEAQQGRALSKNDKKRVRDELIVDLLPQAFKLTRKTYGYFDPLTGYFLIDSDNKAVIDAIIAKLNVGGLVVKRITTVKKPPFTMMQWCMNRQSPSDVILGGSCELVLTGRRYPIKGNPLPFDDMDTLFNQGALVEKMAMNYENGVNFVLDKNLTLSQIKFPAVTFPTSSNAVDLLDFKATNDITALMPLLTRLIAWFGGLS